MAGSSTKGMPPSLASVLKQISPSRTSGVQLASVNRMLSAFVQMAPLIIHTQGTNTRSILFHRMECNLQRQRDIDNTYD